MQPSDFTNYPWNSVIQKSESEYIAMNIMVILARTGDQWRDLTHVEYRVERRKDGNYTASEESYFDQVIRYCKSPDTAALFSPEWDKCAGDVEAKRKRGEEGHGRRWKPWV